MLRYTTRLHDDFDVQWKRAGLSEGFQFPDQRPEPGEEFVRESFSTEWLEYEYDGIIWELSYDAHAQRIGLELGPALNPGAQWHLEVGCGLGVATGVAQERSGCDAVGLDLSLAALKAADHFKSNPFMHFVQASAFWIPLARDWFDLVYSRGALHHTYSTEHAFRSVAKHCKPGGTFYVWLYGPGSIRSTPLRMVLYGLEVVTRPLVARAPSSLFAKSFLATMSLGYVGFNRLRRAANSAIQPLTFSRGLHAARDRFTPRFAHRHADGEVLRWFADAGYGNAEVLDWRTMPPAEQDDFNRNVGIRAVRASV
jgi:SAM-dependent methyltransferase